MSTELDSTSFNYLLKTTKDKVDQLIDDFIKQDLKNTFKEYTPESYRSLEAYYDFVSRGGKRVRAAISVMSYLAAGGKDVEMAQKMSVCLELLHSYILVMDDFMDESVARRGGPTVHKILADYHHAAHFSGRSPHFGDSIAVNLANIGCHLAIKYVLDNSAIDNDTKIKLLNNITTAMIVTGHGQINDIFNEVKQKTSLEDINNVLEWKTAHYTFQNPIQFGLILAGKGQEDQKLFEKYSLYVGMLFQIQDDLIGVFGNEEVTGKKPIDDIIEGKRNILTVYALEHSNNSNHNFLLQSLGNRNLTLAEFDRVKEILVSSGSYQNAQNLCDKYYHKALEQLDFIQQEHEYDMTNLKAFTNVLKNRNK